MNKKGVEFLGGHVVNLIITVIIITLLIFVGLKIYGLFVNEGSDLEQANAQLLKVKEVADRTHSSSEADVVRTFFSPAKNWYLRSFSEVSGDNLQDLPRACIGKIGCLCICNTEDCGGVNACIGTDYDLRFRRVKYNFRNVGKPAGEAEYTQEIIEYMRLSESVYQIRTSVNGGGVLLTPVFR